MASPTPMEKPLSDSSASPTVASATAAHVDPATFSRRRSAVKTGVSTT